MTDHIRPVNRPVVMRRAALLERHNSLYFGATVTERYTNRYKVVLMPPGQSEQFDEGKITRGWLHPHLGHEWHLVEFVNVEVMT